MRALVTLVFFVSTFSAQAQDADEIREEVANQVILLANQIDRFFGEQRAIDANRESTMRLSLIQDVPEGGISGPRLDANLNLKLVNLEKMGNELEKSVLGFDDSQHQTDNVGRRKLQQSKRSAQREPKFPWRLVLDQQVGVKWLPTYSAKFRLTKDFEVSKILNHWTTEYGYDTQNIWNGKINLTSDYFLSKAWMLRWTNELSWFFSNIVINTTHGPSVIHAVNDRTSMSYNFRLDTEYLDSRLLYTSNYMASITYRQEIYNKWVFFETSPSINFPRKEEFRRVLNLMVKFEAFFGDT